MRASGVVGMQAGQRPETFLDHPAIDFDHQAIALGRGNEAVRPDQRAIGADHSNQDFAGTELHRPLSASGRMG